MKVEYVDKDAGRCPVQTEPCNVSCAPAGPSTHSIHCHNRGKYPTLESKAKSEPCNLWSDRPGRIFCTMQSHRDLGWDCVGMLFDRNGVKPTPNFGKTSV